MELAIGILRFYPDQSHQRAIARHGVRHKDHPLTIPANAITVITQIRNGHLNQLALLPLGILLLD
jgi:hypothetical protein